MRDARISSPVCDGEGRAEIYSTTPVSVGHGVPSKSVHHYAAVQRMRWLRYCPGD